MRMSISSAAWLILFLGLDLACVSLLGTGCVIDVTCIGEWQHPTPSPSPSPPTPAAPPHAPPSPPPPSTPWVSGVGDATLGQFHHFLAVIWPSQPFHIGESTFDLWVLSLLRVSLLLVVLPLAARLRVVTPAAATSFANWMLIFVVLWTFAKMLGRLFGAGLFADGFGEFTLPAEGSFWMALVLPVPLAVLETNCAKGLIGRTAPAEPSTDDQGTGQKQIESAEKVMRDANGTEGEEGKEAPSAEEEYVEQTEVGSASFVRTMGGYLVSRRRDRVLFACGMASVLAFAPLNAAIPLFYSRVIGELVEPSTDASAFLVQVKYYVVIAGASALAQGLRQALFIVIGARLSVVMREKLFANYLRQELAFFAAAGSNNMATRLAADCTLVGQQMTTGLQEIFAQLLSLSVTFYFMLTIEWRLGILTFFSVPVVVFIVIWTGELQSHFANKAQDALARANSCAAEVLQTMATVKAFNTQQTHVREYEHKLQAFVGWSNWQGAFAFVNGGIAFSLLPQVAMVLIFYYAFQLSHTPAGCERAECYLDGANVIAMTNYMYAIIGAFGAVSQTFFLVMSSIGAADKILKWTHRIPPSQYEYPSEGGGAAAAQKSLGDIKFIDVTFRYPLRTDKLILDGLSMHAAPGEVVALCGPSGSGKSSTIALLKRFYQNEGGRILLDSLPIEQYPAALLHNLIVMVSQEPVLFAASVSDNITYGLPTEHIPKPSRQDVERVAQMANAHEFIMGFDDEYDQHVGERGGAISGGQKQKIAIARALVRQPKVLLLDEATSALDTESEQIVQATIDEMLAQASMTCFVIAHRLSTISGADKITVIKQGKVIEQGTHAELLQLAGEYANLVSKQQVSAEEAVEKRHNRRSIAAVTALVDGLSAARGPSAQPAPIVGQVAHEQEILSAQGKAPRAADLMDDLLRASANGVAALRQATFASSRSSKEPSAAHASGLATLHHGPPSVRSSRQRAMSGGADLAMQMVRSVKQVAGAGVSAATPIISAKDTELVHTAGAAGRSSDDARSGLPF